MPLRGRKEYIKMLNCRDYELYFDEIGITGEEDKNTVLGFIRELFAIAIQHYNNEVKKVEALV